MKPERAWLEFGSPATTTRPSLVNSQEGTSRLKGAALSGSLQIHQSGTHARAEITSCTRHGYTSEMGANTSQDNPLTLLVLNHAEHPSAGACPLQLPGQLPSWFYETQTEPTGISGHVALILDLANRSSEAPNPEQLGDKVPGSDRRSPSSLCCLLRALYYQHFSTMTIREVRHFGIGMGSRDTRQRMDGTRGPGSQPHAQYSQRLQEAVGKGPGGTQRSTADAPSTLRGAKEGGGDWQQGDWQLGVSCSKCQAVTGIPHKAQGGTGKLYTLKWWILYYLNYISVKTKHIHAHKCVT